MKPGHILLSFLLFIFTVPVFSQEEKMRIAVLELKAVDISAKTASTVSSMLRTDLVNAGKFIVVERSQMDKILAEQGFQQTGCADTECAVQLGRLVSARKILIGELSSLGKTIMINVRIVDVEKGVTDFAAREKASSVDELDVAVTKITSKLGGETAAAHEEATGELPNVPWWVSATDDNSALIKISWRSAIRAVKYHVFRAQAEETKNPDEGSYVEIGNTKETFFEDRTASEKKTYWYRVKSWSPAGYSEFSKAAAGRIGIPGIPGSPWMVQATEENSREVVISWWKAGQAQKYYVYRAASESGAYTEVGSTDRDSFSDKTAEEARIYWYRVKSWSPAGYSDFSSPVSGGRFGKGLLPPNTVYASSDNDKRIKVAWVVSRRSQKYFIYRGDSELGEYKQVGSTGADEYNDADVQYGKVYWYRVRAGSTDGYSKFSTAVPGRLASREEVISAGYYSRAIIPGWGQFYAGSSAKGYLYSFSFAAAGAFTISSAIYYFKSKSDYDGLGEGDAKNTFKDKRDNYIQSAKFVNISLGVLAGIYLLNWIDIIFFTEPDYGMKTAADAYRNTGNSIGMYSFGKDGLGLSCNMRF